MNQLNALISVYNKDGIGEFASELEKLGVTVYSSGGTAKKLSAWGIDVVDTAQYIGRAIRQQIERIGIKKDHQIPNRVLQDIEAAFGKAIMNHRVATLWPHVHGGILRRDHVDTDIEELEEMFGVKFDIVCVDMYPLKDEIVKEGSTRESVIEQTDIGGPTLLRSAAKARRIVICDPRDREFVIKRLKEDGDVNSTDREMLAGKVERVVSQYCLTSSTYITQGEVEGFIGTKAAALRYGENPYQTGVGTGLFSLNTDDPLALERFEHIEGNPMGYINYTDLHRAVETMTRAGATFAVNNYQEPYMAFGLKHGNSYGAAYSFTDPLEALRKMIKGNPGDLFGSFIIANFEIGLKEAEVIRYHLLPNDLKARTIDGLIAPSITPEAVAKLKRKDGACHFLVNPALAELTLDSADQFQYVRGGFLKQPASQFVLNLKNPHPELKIDGELTDDHAEDLLFGMAICQTSNSNTITLVNDQMLIGNGTSRGSRVRAAWLAIQEAKKNKLSTVGAVAVSDSFFPFTDGPNLLIKADVSVIYATLGSKNDQAVIDAVHKSPATFVTLPTKIGRIFYGHK